MRQPELLPSDVLGEAEASGVDFGFGEGLFQAEFQSVPEEFVNSWWWVFRCAEIVVCSLAVCGKLVKLCDGHFSENEHGTNP